MATVNGGVSAPLTQETQGPSPQQEKQAIIQDDRDVTARLSAARAAGPSVRGQTSSEAIDMELLRRQLGNPFSTRYLPFSVLRDMTTDLMLAFGYYFTITPIIRADWDIDCPSAKVAASVDAAFRPIATTTYIRFAQSMWYGSQPLAKRFRLGSMEGVTYRDPQGSDPDKDIPVWNSSADMLLWKPPAALNPSHCMPQWDENGAMAGFTFSPIPIPHADLLGAAGMYGYTDIPGAFIGPDYAMWVTNEQEENFGSIYGSARTKRAYRHWWSYWHRWALADRSFENLADPAKLVYFPTEFDEFVDTEDPSTDAPTLRQRRAEALALGDGAHSGATLAVPGTFAKGADGKETNMREWQVSYLDPKNNFADLDATFAHLDILKLRAWFVPEQALLEGRGGSSSRLVAAQMGETYQESQQMLVDLYDAYVSDHLFPQFIAANFPEHIGIRCRKVTRGLGALDAQLRQQVLTLIGQVRGDVLPVDVRELLRQSNIPLLSEQGMKAQIEQIAALQAISQPTAREPEKVGTQGYNAGVQKTPRGNFYYEPSERIILAESDGFMGSLPDTPHYRDAAARSAILRLRRLYLDRYKHQYASLESFLSDQATLRLAQSDQAALVPQPQQAPDGLQSDAAKATAAAIITAWAASEAPGTVGAAAQAVAEPGAIAGQTAELIMKIGLAGGKGALKQARLDAEDFGADALASWVTQRAAFAVNSVDSTVRDEAQEWLAAQLESSTDPTVVAKAAKSHFEGFAVTHADRVARAEATIAFNRGVLEALGSAGVAQVQAHDASDGHDQLTDAECLHRNGQVFSVQEALAENERTHPNDTLYFTPLSTDHFNVQRVDQIPEHLGASDLHAAYDPASETLYLSEGVDEDRETTYLLTLGRQLRL